MCFGGDVGVFAHGDNVRELEIMVEYGMPAGAAVTAATSGNARLFHSTIASAPSRQDCWPI